MLKLGVGLCDLSVLDGGVIGARAPRIVIEQPFGIQITAAEFLPIAVEQSFEIEIAASEVSGDDVAPVLVSAVIDSAGTTLTLTYDEALDETSEPATTAWTLAGTSSTVSARNVTGSTVVLTLNPAVYRHETITLDYTAPGTNVQDLAGNDAANLNDQVVTNNTAARAADPLAIVQSANVISFLSGDLGLAEAGGAGTGLSTWSDQSGNGNDAIQISSTTARPDLNATGLNGHGVVDFVKTEGHWMFFDDLNLPAPGTTPTFWWIVLNIKTYTSGDNIFSGSSTTVMRCRLSATSNTIGCANPTAGPVATFTPGDWNRLEAKFANSADVNTGDYTKIGATATARGTAVGNNDPGNGVMRLCTDLVTRFGNATIACVLICDGEPTEKATLDAWVTAYYGGSVGL